MKKYILINLFLLFITFCSAQSAADFQLKLDSLNKQRLLLKVQLNEIYKSINYYSDKRNEALTNEQKGLVYVFIKDGSLFDEVKLRNTYLKEGTKVLYIDERDKYSCYVSYNGVIYKVNNRYIAPLNGVVSDKEKRRVADSIAMINSEPFVFLESGELLRRLKDLAPFIFVPAGTEVSFIRRVHGNGAGYPDCKVIYNDTVAYTFKRSLVTKDEYFKIIEKREVAKQKEVNRKQSIINKYGEKDGNRILNKKIWLGMTKEMLKLSWGSPEDINRTVTTYGVSEQWVYSDVYVYVEDGIVTSWQD